MIIKKIVLNKYNKLIYLYLYIHRISYRNKKKQKKMGRSVHTARKSTAVKTIVKTNSDGSAVTKILPKKPNVDGTEKKKKRPANTPLSEWKLRNKLDKRESIIPLAPFERLVREIASNFKDDLRFQRSSILAIREAAELYLNNIFEGTGLLARHAKRKTITLKDMNLFMKTQNMTPCNNFGRNEAELQQHAKKLGWSERVKIKNPYQIRKLEKEIESDAAVACPVASPQEPPALSSVEKEKEPESIDDLF